MAVFGHFLGVLWTFYSPAEATRQGYRRSTIGVSNDPRRGPLEGMDMMLSSLLDGIRGARISENPGPKISPPGGKKTGFLHPGGSIFLGGGFFGFFDILSPLATKYRKTLISNTKGTQPAQIPIFEPKQPSPLKIQSISERSTGRLYNSLFTPFPTIHSYPSPITSILSPSPRGSSERAP